MMAPNEAYVTLAIDVVKEPAEHEESLLSKFGGEEKLKAFIDKIFSSVVLDENFSAIRQNAVLQGLATKFTPDSLLSLAKSLFECENLSEIKEQKEFLNRLGLTQELFDCFYKDHFSKHLKTMKVNIKIVQAVLKKLNSMRDEIVCPVAQAPLLDVTRKISVIS